METWEASKQASPVFFRQNVDRSCERRPSTKERPEGRPQCRDKMTANGATKVLAAPLEVHEPLSAVAARPQSKIDPGEAGAVASRRAVPIAEAVSRAQRGDGEEAPAVIAVSAPAIAIPLAR